MEKNNLHVTKKHTQIPDLNVQSVFWSPRAKLVGQRQDQLRQTISGLRKTAKTYFVNTLLVLGLNYPSSTK